MEKEVKIEYNGKKAVVKLKRFNAGERNDIHRASTDTVFIGNQPRITADPIKMKEVSLVKGIVDAPFPMTLESVRSLDPDIFEYLYQELNSINELTIPKKGSASGDTDTEQETPNTSD